MQMSISRSVMRLSEGFSFSTRSDDHISSDDNIDNFFSKCDSGIIKDKENTDDKDNENEIEKELIENDPVR